MGLDEAPLGLHDVWGLRLEIFFGIWSVSLFVGVGGSLAGIRSPNGPDVLAIQTGDMLLQLLPTLQPRRADPHVCLRSPKLHAAKSVAVETAIIRNTISISAQSPNCQGQKDTRIVQIMIKLLLDRNATNLWFMWHAGQTSPDPIAQRRQRPPSSR